MDERLGWEKELLGLYISGHPLDKFKERLAKRTMTLNQLKEKVRPGSMAVTGGMIEDVRVVGLRISGCSIKKSQLGFNLHSPGGLRRLVVSNFSITGCGGGGMEFKLDWEQGKATLKSKGTLTIKAKITFSPEGGTPRTQTYRQEGDLDAAAGTYVDLVAAGVVDPVKVTRSAVANAASIAGLLITTETLVADKPEDQPADDGHGHGHGHAH